MAATGGTSDAQRRARAGAGLVKTGVSWSSRALDAIEARAMTAPVRVALTASLAVVVAVLFGVAVAGSTPIVFALVGLVPMVPAAAVDLRVRLLPDALVVAMLPAGLLALWWPDNAVAGAGALLGVLAMGGPLLAVHLVRPAAMGFGDVKAGGAIGLLLGIVDPVAALAALAVAGGVTAVGGLALGHREVPLGPGLLAGSATALVWFTHFAPGGR